MPVNMPQGVSPGAIAAILAVTAVFAYFCGCFNGAVIVSKYILRDDVRKHGSGNAGLTNFYRTYGALDLCGYPHRRAQGGGGHSGGRMALRWGGGL